MLRIEREQCGVKWIPIGIYLGEKISTFRCHNFSAFRYRFSSKSIAFGMLPLWLANLAIRVGQGGHP